MPSIFHYTNVAGLLGILASRTLFATDYRYLNDSTEGSAIKELILPVFEAEVAEVLPKLRAKGLLNGFYEFHGVRGHQLQADGMYRSIVKVVHSVSPLFVVSFCRHDEGSQISKDGLLSQWRGYGVAGGFAIELDETRLDDLLRAETRKFAYAGGKSDDVRYDKYEEVFDAKVY